MIRPYLYYAFKIKDGLFIGNKRAANDIQFQFYNKITVIINCAALEINISNPKVKILNFEWLDTEEQQIVVNNNVDMVYNTIEETNDNGESVLICCLTGQSRSVAIVAAYFMKKFNWNLKTSLQYLQICRKDFEIREGFLFQLSRYERELLIKLKTDLTEQNEQVQEQEILLKNTYYNAKLSEIWSNYNMSEKTSGFSKVNTRNIQKSFLGLKADNIYQYYFRLCKIKSVSQLKMNLSYKNNLYSKYAKETQKNQVDI